METENTDSRTSKSNIPWGWIIGGLGLLGAAYYFFSQKAAAQNIIPGGAIIPGGVPDIPVPTQDQYRLGYWEWEILKTPALAKATIDKARLVGNSPASQLQADAQVNVTNGTAPLADYQSFVDAVNARLQLDTSSLSNDDKIKSAINYIVTNGLKTAVLAYQKKYVTANNVPAVQTTNNTIA